MKRTIIKGLLCMVILSVLGMGCNDSVGPYIPPDYAQEITTKLVDYFGDNSIAVTIGSGGLVQSSDLESGLESLATDSYELFGILSYTAESGEEAPFVTYTLSITDSNFHEIDLGSANGNLIRGAMAGAYWIITNNHSADGPAGYSYLDGIELTMENDGSLIFTIILTENPVAQNLVSDLNGGINTVVITNEQEMGFSTVGGKPLGIVRYLSVSKDLVFTIPAPGITYTGAQSVADALFSALDNKVNNNVDFTWNILLSAAPPSIIGGNVVITVRLTNESQIIISDNSAIVDRMVAYYEGGTFNITIPTGTGAPTSAALTTAATLNSGIAYPGYSFTGALTYTAAVGQPGDANYADPFIEYTMSSTSSATYDRIYFNNEDGQRIGAAIGKGLGAITNNRAGSDAYRYPGEITSRVITDTWPVASQGNVAVRITLVQDQFADSVREKIDDMKELVFATEGQTINLEASDNSVFGTAQYAGITVTASIPAAGITASGAQGVGQAFFSALADNITNNVNLGYLIPASFNAVITGNNVVVTVPLLMQSVEAALITDAINGSDPDIIITGSNVTGDVITNLADIADATGAAVAASYDSASKTITVTVPPADQYAFAANAYSTVLTALAGKIGDITNNTDADYVSILSQSVSVTGGNLVFTFVLSNIRMLTAVDITGPLNALANNRGITINSASDVTGDIFSALDGIPNTTLTVSYIMPTITFVVTPDNNFVFDPGVVVDGNSPYSTIPGIVGNKIGNGTITNSVSPHYNIFSIAGTEVREGIFRLFVTFRMPYVANSFTVDGKGNVTLSNTPIVNAINGTANSTTLTIENATTITGDLIDNLADIANATSTVTTAWDNASNSMVLTLAPAEGFLFNPANGIYDPTQATANVGTVFYTKIGNLASITNEAAPGFTTPLGSSISVTVSSMVLTVNFGNIDPANIIAEIDAVDDDSTLTVQSLSSVTGPVITALGNIPGGTGLVTTNYNASNSQLRVLIAHPAGQNFGPSATPYAGVGTALRDKIIAGTIVNNVQADRTAIYGAATTAFSQGSILITMTLDVPRIAADVITTAISDAADGDLIVVSTTNVTGAVIDSLRAVSQIGNVSAQYDASGNRIILTIMPAFGNVFAGTNADYHNAVRDALQELLDEGTLTNEVAPTFDRYGAGNYTAVSLQGANLQAIITLSEDD